MMRAGRTVMACASALLAFALHGSAQACGLILGQLNQYSSTLYGLGGKNFNISIRGNGAVIDDLAGFFVDADLDGRADGFNLDALSGGGSVGDRTFGFAVVEVDGVRMLTFPTIASNGFPLTPADVLPGVPATALPMVPITEDDRFELTLGDGTPILAFDLLIDEELLSDLIFDSSFEADEEPAP